MITDNSNNRKINPKILNTDFKTDSDKSIAISTKKSTLIGKNADPENVFRNKTFLGRFGD